MKYFRCPHCGGFLDVDNDGSEDYLTCCGCAKSFNLNRESMRMTPAELFKRIGIKLSHIKKSAN